MSVAAFTVKDSSIGGKECNPERPSATAVAKMNNLDGDLSNDIDLPENLGPPLKVDQIAPLSKMNASESDNIYCTDEIRQRGEAAAQKEEDACSQRLELRLQKSLRFPSAKTQTYSFRFRMPIRVLDTEHSIRWIIGQWKQEPVHEKKHLASLPTGPSPVIAQRYADGILRITVQSDLCRCVVAAASPTDTKGNPWANGTPKDCSSIDAPRPKGSACEKDPELTATYYENGGALTSPFQNWVEMKYVMKFTGVIGYTPHTTKKPMTKFKFGIYRDYIPQEDTIDVDWVRVSVDE